MTRIPYALALVTAVLCAAPAGGLEPQTIELRAGRYWEPVKSPTTAPVSDPAIDRAAEILETGNPAAAKSLVLGWIKRQPRDAALRDRALFLLGVANFKVGERVESYYNFDELMDLYPESRYFYAALERQYDIADAYLNGYKNKFLGMPILGAQDEAIEMLFRIQQRSPGSPLAEKALRRTGDYYYANADYDLAADAYQVLIKDYSRSPEIPQVKLKRAFAQLAQFKGTKFDPTPVINARTALEEIQNDYPELARQENVAAIIERIDSAVARKHNQTAAFYTKTNQPKSAALYYQYVIKNFPNAPEAATARAELARLPQWAQQTAATQPSAAAR
ncbi:MAG: outer membrane protein assembly factor BamD [Phycisphaerae bacterium]|nr:outer membrane protein assembly factor BamD [Tepidisphaeraceae bacterium]